MSQKFLDQQPEFFFSTSETSHFISPLLKSGKIRKVGPRLYTKNMSSGLERLVKSKVWELVKAYFPGALIADRTAFDLSPAKDGSVFVIPAGTAKKPKDIKLPGITIRPRYGKGPLKDDSPYLGDLFLPSQARIFLENMKTTRARQGVARRLSQNEIEEALEKILQRGGEDQLQNIRDQSRKIAKSLDLEKEADQLHKLIGALLGTKDFVLMNESGKARLAGTPFDADRVKLFHYLHQSLLKYAPHTCKGQKLSADGWEHRAFFEAYFSNYIEGTEFELEEAKSIIFDGQIPQDRPDDAHDIMGTYEVVVSHDDIKRTPTKATEMLDLLKERHFTVMEARTAKRPGQFKQKSNRAGLTQFVKPDLVIGTLKKGFEFYPSLVTPFQRAAFMMFMVSEVHPFVDGNGRIARIMMNAELVNASEGIIIIPTVYRNNYLTSLKALSNGHNADGYIRVLDFAQRWTNKIRWNNFKQANDDLTASNAFLDATVAEDQSLRLRFPD